MDRVLLRRQSLGEPSWRTTYLVDQLVEVDEIGSGPLQGSTRSGGKCNTGIYIYYVISQSVFINTTSGRKPIYLYLSFML